MPDQPFDAFAAEVNILSNLLRKSALNLHKADALPPGALSALKLLKENGPITVPRMGRLRLTSRQNIQIMVNRLRAAGWVEVFENPGHRRSSLVRLTPAGEQALDGATRSQPLHVQALLDKVSTRELETATLLLQRIRGIVHEQMRSQAKEKRRNRGQVAKKASEPARPSEVPAAKVVQPVWEADLEEMPISLL